MASAGIVEVVALEGGTPVRKDQLELATVEVGLDKLRGRVGQTQTVQSRVKRRSEIIECELAVHTDGELARVLLELPRVDRA
jgi:hypothetical protein